MMGTLRSAVPSCSGMANNASGRFRENGFEPAGLSTVHETSVRLHEVNSTAVLSIYVSPIRAELRLLADVRASCSWTYFAQGAPNLHNDYSTHLGLERFCFVLTCLGLAHCVVENKLREKFRRNHRIQGLSENGKLALGHSSDTWLTAYVPQLSTSTALKEYNPIHYHT